MADSPIDPVATWQKFVSDWEKQVNETSARFAGTEEFSRAMNQATKLSMMAQQQFEKQMEQLLKTYHMPSKSDIAGINERLASIEETFAQLVQALAPRNSRPEPKIARTRRPPADAS